MMTYIRAGSKRNRPSSVTAIPTPSDLEKDLEERSTWASKLYDENQWDSVDEIDPEDPSKDGRYLLELEGSFVLASTKKIAEIVDKYGVAGKNTVVYDLKDHIKHVYGINGQSGVSSPFHADLVPQLLKSVKQPIIEDKEFDIKGTKELTIEDVFNIVNKPVLFFSDIKEEKTNINYLLVETLCNPGSFDELFIVQEKAPESPLLKSYLENLANYLIVELKNKDEIDNLEELQKKAYDKTKYQGKLFETVLEEAKDFSEYLRFLITKDEKLVVSPEEFKYSTNLYSAIRSFGQGIKGKNQKLHVELKMDLFTDYFVSTKINQQTNTGGRTFFREIIYIPDIRNLATYIEEEGYDLKIAFIKKMLNAVPIIFVCDRDYNFQTVEVKSSTILKWIKKLDSIFGDVKRTMEQGGRHFPNCVDNVLI